jgi:hypothetical protein
MKRPIAKIALTIALGSVSSFGNQSCDHDCLKTWFKQQFRFAENLPPEVAAEVLITATTSQADKAKSLFLLEKVAELIPSIPEPCPIRNTLRFTDSIPGATAKLLVRYPTKNTIAVDRLKLFAKLDLEAAAEEFKLLQLADTINQESCSLRHYFEFAFELAEAHSKAKEDLKANLVILHSLSMLRSNKALGEFHETLLKRMQQNRLGAPLLALYQQRLATFQFADSPDALSWGPTCWFWQSLLTGEFAAHKLELLESIATFVGNLPASEQEAVRMIVTTRNGTSPLPIFWPQEAIKQFKLTVVSALSEEKEEKLGASMIRSLESRNAKKVREVTTSLLWARPQSKQLFDSLVELKKTWDQKNLIGAWEPSLATFLGKVQNHAPENKTQEDELLTFLERHYCWLQLFSFSTYFTPPDLKAVKPEDLQGKVAARPPHTAKQSILRDVLANLESEEGRKIYARRRALWIGTIRLYRDEILKSQPELLDFWKQLASASANDIIGAYSN